MTRYIICFDVTVHILGIFLRKLEVRSAAIAQECLACMAGKDEWKICIVR